MASISLAESGGGYNTGIPKGTEMMHGTEADARIIRAVKLDDSQVITTCHNHCWLAERAGPAPSPKPSRPPTWGARPIRVKFQAKARRPRPSDG